jgi:hypothetical protein
MAAIIALLATLCAGVLMASMHGYQAVDHGIQRLQLQAAAEGGAIFALESEKGEGLTSRTLNIGDCTIELSRAMTQDTLTTGAASSEDVMNSSATLVRMKVTLVQRQRPVVWRNYRIVMVTGSADKPILQSIEAVP